jgi:hypothetical protein
MYYTPLEGWELPRNRRLVQLHYLARIYTPPTAEHCWECIGDWNRKGYEDDTQYVYVTWKHIP